MNESCMQALAKVVAQHMGGHGKTDAELYLQWQRVSRQLKRQHRSVTIPISALTSGLARHRALLFKVLADFCQIPCRLLRGQFYTGTCFTYCKSKSCQECHSVDAQSTHSISRSYYLASLWATKIVRTTPCEVHVAQHNR